MARAKKEVAVTNGKAVTGWAERVAKAAQRQQKSAEFMGGGSNWISFKGGLITVAGATSPGGAFNCIILGYMQERAWYKNEFDGAQAQAPDCYAYGDEDGHEPTEPHEKAPHPVSDACRGCQFDEWASANKGRGKACRQSIRLALVPATADGVIGPLFFARVPPTSIKNVRGWINALGEAPCFTVVTELQVKPSAENMFDVVLVPKLEIPRAFQEGIITQLDNVQDELRQPYAELEEKAPPPKRQPAKKGAARGKF